MSTRPYPPSAGRGGMPPPRQQPPMQQQQQQPYGNEQYNQGNQGEYEGDYGDVPEHYQNQQDQQEGYGEQGYGEDGAAPEGGEEQEPQEAGEHAQQPKESSPSQGSGARNPQPIMDHRFAQDPHHSKTMAHYRRIAKTGITEAHVKSIIHILTFVNAMLAESIGMTEGHYDDHESAKAAHQGLPQGFQQ